MRQIINVEIKKIKKTQMIKIIKSGKFSWANANDTDEATMNRLKKLFRVHPLDIEDIQSERHDPKLDVYKNYLFAIFNVPKYTSRMDHIRAEELDIFIGRNFLVTLYKGDLSEVNDIFIKLEKNSNLRRDWLGRGVDFLHLKFCNLFLNQGCVLLQINYLKN